MARIPVLTFTDRGIFCPAGDFHIDPWRPVDRALITHGHSDHARPGHGQYLCTHQAAPVIRHRLGPVRLETIAYGEQRRIGGVTVSFHPAGHVPGSAQIRVERDGEVWVVSGDYKVSPDGLSEPFEPVACHTFISECTFGLPVFRWEPQEVIMAQINQWWAANAADGSISILGAYALGKAQRILGGLDPSIGPILTHGAVEVTTEILRTQGYSLPTTVPVTAGVGAKSHPRAIVIAPPSAEATPWATRFGPTAAAAFASGWMRLRGVRRRRGAETGFVLSDHADWPSLLTAIGESGASRVLVTHGSVPVMVRRLREMGLEADALETVKLVEAAGAPADWPVVAELLKA